MKHLLFCFFFLPVCYFCTAQQIEPSPSRTVSYQLDMRTGDWKSYLSYRRSLQSALKGDELYTITSGGLFSYNLNSKELRTYSTVEGLSSIQVSAIYHNPANGWLYVGHADGSIDYFQSADHIRNQIDIRINSFYTQKYIYNFCGDADYVCAATDFGLVVFSADEMQPKFTVSQIADNPSRTPVTSAAMQGNTLWAVMKNGFLYKAAKNAPNLADPSAWTKESNGMPNVKARYIVSDNQRVYALMEDGFTYHLGPNGWEVFGTFGSTGSSKLSISGDYVAAYWWGEVRVSKHDGTFVKYYVWPNSNAADVYVSANDIYISTEYDGLHRYANMGEEFEPISPKGPYTNDCVNVAAKNGELYIAPAGYDVIMTPVPNDFGIYYYHKGTGWKNLRKNDGLPANRANGNFVRVHYDEKSTDMYVGAWGKGVVKLKEGELQAFYDCGNSSISLTNGYNCDTSDWIGASRVAGTALDNDGNLWIAQQYAVSPLQVLKKDGSWLNMRASSLSNTRISGITIDDYGNKWLAAQKANVYIYNEKETLDDPNDDILLTLTTTEKQGNLPSNNVFCVVKDLDGDIWLGTDQGVRVMYANFLYDLSQGKYADVRAPIVEGYPLLRSELVNAIAVDGGNRKWIGTNNGVFLVSEDGLQILQQFTTENSPLPSNLISHIAIDNSTGEIFFATSLGLVSYRGTATSGVNPCQEVSVFPNPVFTDYAGDITLDGLGAESIVKITTISGALVRELRSQGGTAIWNGTDVQGRKVKSGVYLAFGANKNGENSCVGKFTVIER